MIDIIPAVDIMDGHVVRLAQGNPLRKTIYADSPLEAVQRWASYGVRLIHIVDLDGAISGRMKNFNLICRIAQTVKSRIELGGGLRDLDTIKRAFDVGIDRVVIGTKALDRRFLNKVMRLFAGRIVAGIDAKGGAVRTMGWFAKTKLDAIRLTQEMAEAGIKTINYTDISRDGMLEGPNIEGIKALLKSADVSVVASGGVSKIEDVVALRALEGDGLKGMIIGRALYENRIDLGEAIRVCG